MSRREATGMTTESHSLRGRLVAIAAGYLHTREEHRRARRGGHTRRSLEARLEELSRQFERLLGDSELDETVRAEWRQRIYHGGPEPDAPPAEPAPVAHRPPRNRGRGSAPLWQR
jgi:hypothetical protein